MNALSSDDARFEAIAREYVPALMRVAGAYTRNAADRDDLFQEIMWAVWRALPGFRGDASMRTFIFRIAHNRGLTFRSRGGPAAVSLDAVPDPASPGVGIETAVERADESARLREALLTLSPLLRQVITLQLEGLSAEEIAEATGASINVVNVRAHRARLILRARLAYLRTP